MNVMEGLSDICLAKASSFEFDKWCQGKMRGCLSINHESQGKVWQKERGHKYPVPSARHSCPDTHVRAHTQTHTQITSHGSHQQGPSNKSLPFTSLSWYSIILYSSIHHYYNTCLVLCRSPLCQQSSSEPWRYELYKTFRGVAVSDTKTLAANSFKSRKLQDGASMDQTICAVHLTEAWLYWELGNLE